MGSEKNTVLQVKLGVTILFYEVPLALASVTNSLCLKIKLYGISLSELNANLAVVRN